MKTHTLCALASLVFALQALPIGSSAFVATAFAADEALSTGQLRALIVGKTVSLTGGGRATYNADGSYVFRGGGVWRGRYRISGGRVCVNFTKPSGSRRCDRYVKSGKRYYLINGSGKKFRARIR